MNCSRATAWIVLLSSMALGCPGYSPDTPLTRAAARGDAPKVRELLGRGISPDLLDGAGMTALEKQMLGGFAPEPPLPPSATPADRHRSGCACFFPRCRGAAP